MHPAADETANNDGWAAFSGTSAAAPQLAGICALMKQANATLTPTQARNILKRTATDVTVGAGNPATGGIAGPGYDLATGAGLADAHRATMLARLQAVVVPTGNMATPTVAPLDQFPGVLLSNGHSLTPDDYQAFEEVLMGMSL